MTKVLRETIKFMLVFLLGAAAMFFGRGYLRGDWPFNTALHVPPAESLPQDPTSYVATNAQPGASATTQAARSVRPASWARPLSAPGLMNFYQVSDTLYRGAQPTAEGMAQLKAMGIKTVVNLRSFHSDGNEPADAGLAGERIWMQAWHGEEEDVVKFLKIVADPARQPVFVHCQHGSDRTGTMCAVYRIVVQGWTKDHALAEMTQGGFGFHEDFNNLLRFINGLDVQALRHAAGLPTAATP